MLKTLLTAALLTISITTHAQHLRVGNSVVMVGDPAGRVVRVMGQPLERRQVVNKFGAPVAERWYYRHRGREVSVLIVETRQGRAVGRIDRDWRRD